MKKSFSILIILTLFCIPDIYAHTDTLFINALGASVSREKAENFRIVSRTRDSLYEFRDYDLNHQIIKIFHAASAAATILEGSYVQYQGDFVSVQGNYHKGFKTGTWHYFYAETERKKEVQIYSSLHEYYSYQYDSLTQRLEYEGGIDKFGKRSGVWKQYHYNSDSIKLVSNYVIGKKEGLQYEYYSNGQLKRKEYYFNNKFQHGDMYDESGKKIKYYPAFTYPQYREYLSNYLQHAEPCTAEALKKNDFQVKLSISKEGQVTDAAVMNVEAADCAEKIKIALLKMKKWKPALWENQAVKYTYEASIKLYVPKD